MLAVFAMFPVVVVLLVPVLPAGLADLLVKLALVEIRSVPMSSDVLSACLHLLFTSSKAITISWKFGLPIALGFQHSIIIEYIPDGQSGGASK
jgi:ABC-type sulfate transport system permease component